MLTKLLAGWIQTLLLERTVGRAVICGDQRRQ